MKRRFASAIFLLAMFAGSTVWGASPTKFVFTWGYTPNTVPICTSTVTTACVNQFIITEPTTGISITIPAVAGTSSYTASTPLPAAGTYTYSLVASETLGGSTAIPSPAVTVSLQSPGAPGPADHFTGSPQ